MREFDFMVWFQMCWFVSLQEIEECMGAGLGKPMFLLHVAVVAMKPDDVGAGQYPPIFLVSRGLMQVKPEENGR